MAFTLQLYYFAFLSIFSFVLGNNPWPFPNLIKYTSLSLLPILITLTYFRFLHKKKYLLIINKTKIDNKSKFASILFPLVAFFLWGLFTYLKILRNQQAL